MSFRCRAVVGLIAMRATELYLPGRKLVFTGTESRAAFGALPRFDIPK